MKRTLSLLLVLAMVLLVPMASLAEAIAGPVSIPHGKSVYEVTVTDFSFSYEDGARLFLQAQDGYFLVRFMHEEREAGFEPLEDIVLPIGDGDSPFYSAVLVALEVDGQVVPFTTCNATHNGIEFLYDVSAPPVALLIYPRDGGPETYVRLALPEGLPGVAAPTPEPTAEPTPEPTEAPTPEPEPEVTATPGPTAAPETPVPPADTGAAPAGLERAAAKEHPAEPVAEPMAEPAVDDWRFTVGGNTYEIYRLEDEPASPRENMLDGRPGHCIQFAYAPSDTTGSSNSVLYDLSKVITPDGEVIRTYSNAGNLENPYSLYYGLPDGVLLSDCMLRVPDDDGERLISLANVPGASATSAPTEVPAYTPEPISTTDSSGAPGAVAAPPLSNKDVVKP